MSKGMGVLITGGAGFIGSHLGRRLVQMGYRVRSLDLVEPKVPVPGVEYLREDVRNAQAVQSALRDMGALCHFAAIASVQRCQEEPVESYRTNLLSTPIVLEALMRERDRSGNPLRILFSGTSAVYGEAKGPGVPNEEDQPLSEPLSFYASQKIASEQAIRLFCRSRGVPAVVFRFFNVYGPGQDPASPYSGVISVFTKRALEGAPLRLNGGGTQTRDFVSVHDVVEACERGLQLEASRCDGSPINLAYGKSVTIRELAHLIVEASGRVPGQAFGRKSSIENAPPREGDIQDSAASIQRAREVLRWEPRISLEKGLSELLSSF